jgi:integrase
MITGMTRALAHPAHPPAVRHLAVIRSTRPAGPGQGAAAVTDAEARAETRDGQALPAAVLRAHLRYLQLAGMTDGTIYQRRRLIASVGAAVAVPLLEATEADLMAWRETLGRLAECTIGQYVGHLRQFYAWAAETGLRADNPARALPVPPQRRRIPRPISEADLMAALEAAPERIRPWLVLAGWAGLRAKEIALLRRENVLDNTRPPVLLIASDATKGRRERIVPMSGFVLDELRRAGLPRAGYLFRRRDMPPLPAPTTVVRGEVTHARPALASAEPNRPAIISRLAHEHLRACGIDATLHQLRHRFGTMTYQGSLDLRLVQELLGHANPGTTAAYAAYHNASAARVVSGLPMPVGYLASDLEAGPGPGVTIHG